MELLTIGPAEGSLALHTDVEGRAAKMGHRLTIGVRDWSGRASLDDGVPTAVELRAAAGSLEVTDGQGGVKPLSAKDRDSIRENALSTMKAAEHPEIVFTSERVEPVSGGFTVAGRLSIAGVERPVSVEVRVSDEATTWLLVSAAAVVQSEFGLKPYSAMMGALRVRDLVDVRLKAAVPKSAAPGGANGD